MFPVGLYPGTFENLYMNSDYSQLPHLRRPHYQTEIEESTHKTPVHDPKLFSESFPRPLPSQFEVPTEFTPLGQLQPLPDSLFTIREQGLSNPRILRMTMNSIPILSGTVNNLGLPFAAVWQPAADLDPNDDQIQTIPYPPYRCTSCYAYINPFFTFVNYDQKFVCNICGNSQVTPEIYRGDRANKIEFLKGTYDFEAPKDYSNRQTQMPLYLFCIDVTSTAQELGLLQQVLASVRAVLDSLPYPERTLIGFLTFDAFLQIFKITNAGDLTEVIMTDIDDPFIPEPVEGFCYNALADREKLEQILEKLSTLTFTTSARYSLSTGAILTALKDSMLKSRGGRVIIFASQLGTMGKFSLPLSQDKKLHHSEAEKAYLPDENYLLLSQACCEEDICVDIFVCTNVSVGLRSLGVLCSQTGGDLYYFPSYKSETDGERLYYYIARLLTRTQYSQITMRARCSNGISVDYYVGKYKRKSPVEMDVACIDSDKSFVIVLKHDEKLVDDKEYYIQCAMLFSNYQGKMMIRITNGKITATKNVQNVVNNADIDASANAMMRIGIYSLFEKSLVSVREGLHNSVVNLLSAFRGIKNDFNFSKLCVPETLKYLPLYISCCLKLPALTISSASIESRCFSIHAILSMSVHFSRMLLYPRVYSLHDLLTQDFNPGTYSEHGFIILPKVVPCYLQSLKSEGIYLINNGEIMLFFIGKEVNPEILSSIWDTSSFEDLSNKNENWVLCEKDNEYSQRILAIIEEIRRRNPGVHAAIYYYFEGQGQNYMIKRLMAEDAYGSEISYSDFLTRIHKTVMNKLTSE